MPLTTAQLYNVTLKNFVTPWTNEAQTVFAPLNDYTTTVIGVVLNDDDFREILSGDYVYTGGASVSPAYSPDSNAHYAALEDQNIDLSTVLTIPANKITQPIDTQEPGIAAAGVMTTRAASRAFFIDGTNRAMFRFTVLNHLCYDLEQIKDTTRPADRVRQDVSRSPGGDSRLFLNNCVGCHAGMDPMTQAFAYYDWEYQDGDPMTDDDPDAGVLSYNAPATVDPFTGTRVKKKYHINASNFKGGYATPDNAWTNYWRRGANVWLGWDGPPLTVTSGVGAKSLGAELANSDAFARCQVKKVFKAVCLRDPQIAPNPDATTNDDTSRFDTMVANFKATYHLKDVFAETAAYCSGPRDPIADPYGQ